MPKFTFEGIPEMTLRDYFAANALPALISDIINSATLVSKNAYMVADAMLAERSKNEQ